MIILLISLVLLKCSDLTTVCRQNIDQKRFNMLSDVNEKETAYVELVESALQNNPFSVMKPIADRLSDVNNRRSWEKLFHDRLLHPFEKKKVKMIDFKKTLNEEQNMQKMVIRCMYMAKFEQPNSENDLIAKFYSRLRQLMDPEKNMFHHNLMVGLHQSKSKSGDDSERNTIVKVLHKVQNLVASYRDFVLTWMASEGPGIIGGQSNLDELLVDTAYKSMKVILKAHEDLRLLSSEVQSEKNRKSSSSNTPRQMKLVNISNEEHEKAANAWAEKCDREQMKKDRAVRGERINKTVVEEWFSCEEEVETAPSNFQEDVSQVSEEEWFSCEEEVETAPSNSFAPSQDDDYEDNNWIEIRTRKPFDRSPLSAESKELEHAKNLEVIPCEIGHHAYERAHERLLQGCNKMKQMDMVRFFNSHFRTMMGHGVWNRVLYRARFTPEGYFTGEWVEELKVKFRIEYKGFYLIIMKVEEGNRNRLAFKTIIPVK